MTLSTLCFCAASALNARLSYEEFGADPDELSAPLDFFCHHTDSSLVLADTNRAETPDKVQASLLSYRRTLLSFSLVNVK